MQPIAIRDFVPQNEFLALELSAQMTLSTSVAAGEGIGLRELGCRVPKRRPAVWPPTSPFPQPCVCPTQPVC